MDGNADADAADATTGEGPERAVDPVVLNALADVVFDESPPVLADDDSRDLVRTVLEDVTTEEERRQFSRAIATARSDGESGAAAGEEVSAVVDAVRDSLASRDVRVVVDHEASFSLDPTDVAVYNFSRSRSPSALSGLDLPQSVTSHVEEGARRAAEDDFEAAAAAFASGVDEAGMGKGSVVTRSLAAWAHHWAGDDHGAIDFVEEALHLHMDAWSPSLAGYSADPDRSFAWPRQFRDGKYAAMAALRYTVDCPEGTELTPFLGLGDSDGAVEEWIELDGVDECTPIHRLASENTLRLRLEGDVPAFPAMHSYYVGLGIVDLEVTELREVYRLFIDGPLGDRVTETIRFVTDD